MISYKDKTFCTARCDNLKCDRKIGYSGMRHAEKLNLPVAFADLGKSCEERFVNEQEEKEEQALSV